MIRPLFIFFFFFFNDTATTEIYTLSLHDALPISRARGRAGADRRGLRARRLRQRHHAHFPRRWRSEEHTSELQSPCNLVCRLLLEKIILVTVRGPHVLPPRRRARPPGPLRCQTPA